ncbi:kinase non-catalytic C-lobe domain-containing protein 1 isoform X2 [Amia ocellicauda]|uniref:kinase non-catalytic C-lobe domain-containing protein 1 isoform X2 n=1 Tax=Amia ocellicauda TaxID=2972642 RepID=UPI0034639725
MGTFETAVAVYYEEEEEEEEYYDFEPLPTLLEDEENVSLADILSLRDNCLAEQEIWAVCLECALSLKCVAHSALFHTLCITPDTLAFNAHGNVCFMEQLSDDPEGSFVPPEFDRTGNTFEAHVYSLGSTLTAAVEFVIEPELETQLSQDLKVLLHQMQQENPEDRPNIEDIIALGELKLNHLSSASICRKLSAIGRRVLSIESVGTFQDGCDNSWKVIESKAVFGLKRQVFEHNPADGSSSDEDLTADLNVLNNCIAGTTEGSMATQDAEEEEALLRDELTVNHLAQRNGAECTFELRSKNASTRVVLAAQKTSPVKEPRAEQHLRTLSSLNRRSPVSNTGALPILPFHVHRTVSVTDLSEIAPEEKTVTAAGSFESNNCKPSSQCSNIPELFYSNDDMHVGTVESLECSPLRNGNSNSSARRGVPSLMELNTNTASTLKTETAALRSFSESLVNNNIYSSDNHRTKSMLCLNEESQDEWISLKELLSRCGRPLSVNELWALCHACLSTLQTYIDYPAVLCLDSVYIGCEGELLFLNPKNTGSCDAFYLAPEFQEHGIVTEKVCVYGVAAILWAAAKFNSSPSRKLALPRKLKRLLLEMAKRTPIERPSIASAQKTCRDYLFQQGTDPETVWAELIGLVHQPRREDVAEPQSVLDNETTSNQQDSSSFKTGFVPIVAETRLSAVQGPVPCGLPSSCSSQLPAAYTSPATHFKPIILSQDTKGSTNECTSSSAKPRGKATQHETIPKKGPVAAKDVTPEDRELTDALIRGESHGSSSVENDCSSTSSSGRTLINSPSLVSLVCTEQERLRTMDPAPVARPAVAPAMSDNPMGNRFNNFLLRQDPKTGLLTLLPVQIAIPEPIPGLEFDTVPRPRKPPDSTDDEVWGPMNQKSGVCDASGDDPNRTPRESERRRHRSAGAEISGPPASAPVVSPTPDRYAKLSPKPRGSGVTEVDEKVNSSRGFPEDKAVKHLLSSSSLCQMNACLLSVVHLIKEEFAFDGYLENGVEDLAMGEYILSLRDLQYATFCSAVSEKFCDLYWDERLLEALYKVVNGKHGGRGALSYSKSLSSLDPPVQFPSRVSKRAASPPSGPQRRLRLKEVPEHWQSLPTTRDTGVQDEQSREGGTASFDRASPDLNPVDCPQTPLLNDNSEGRGDRSLSAAVILKYPRADDMDSSDTPPDGADETPADSPSFSAREGCFSSSAFSVRGESLDYSEDDDSLISDRMPENGRSPSPFPGDLRKCSAGWAVAFYGEECFGEDVLKYVKKLGRRNDSRCMEAKMLELQQQLMMETRNLKKTRIFYQKLLHQERKNKGSEAKIMLPKLKAQMEEMRTKVEFLNLVKKYLVILCVEQWGLEVSLLPSLAQSGSDLLDLQPQESSPLLSFQQGTARGKSSPSKMKTLQAGTPLGLMSYLFARNAALQGYIQQFLYIFRYFCSPEELLQFLIDKCTSAAGANQGGSADHRKVYSRSLDVLQAWVEDCKQIDFLPKSSLLQTLEEFIISKVVPSDSRGESLLALIQSVPQRRTSCAAPCSCDSAMTTNDREDTRSLTSLSRKTPADDPARKGFHWRISKAAEPPMVLQKDKAYSIAAALPKPCYSSLVEELAVSCLKMEDKNPFFQSEYSVQQTAQQLTLLQQEIFQGCHPVHFLNSRALGVKDKTMNITRTFSPEAAEGSSLFAPVVPLDRSLLQLLRFADNVSNWVSAEIVIGDTVKTQTGLLSKFLLIAKFCYESRNFATAMQILGGLENVIVRQLPAWKNLSAKVCDILEELRAVQVFLKSDNLCLMEGEQFKKLPTIPADHVLAMHVQQLEIGAFTMANGAYKWPKLRNIAKVVSQVHAFQENLYAFVPDVELQTYLRHRVARFSDADIPLLAAENNTNFHQIPTDKHSRKIQDTLRRMKATFQ